MKFIERQYFTCKDLAKKSLVSVKLVLFTAFQKSRTVVAYSFILSDKKLTSFFPGLAFTY